MKNDFLNTLDTDLLSCFIEHEHKSLDDALSILCKKVYPANTVMCNKDKSGFLNTSRQYLFSKYVLPVLNKT